MLVGTLLSAMSLLSRLPTVYIAHGGGPFPVLGDPGHAGLTAALKCLSTQINVTKPSAILVVSAHWEVRSHLTFASGAIFIFASSALTLQKAS